MTQRTWAALLAVPLFVAMGVFAAVHPLPFVTYAPGPTLNVLGQNSGKPIVEVQGHRTYRDAGQLRMTTVSVTQRDARLDLFTLMRAWFARDDAVYPYAVQYGSGGSQQEDQQEGQVEMISSQDSAIAAALRLLGYQVHPVLEILSVTPKMPADGKLRVRDIIRRFDGTRVNAGTDLGNRVRDVMGRGDLVSDDLMIELIRTRLEQPDTDAGFVLDGFPRTLVQAEALDSILSSIGRSFSVVFSLQIPDEVAFERLRRRAQLEGRADDTDEAIQRRLDLYHEETEPLIEYYRTRGRLVPIHGDRSENEVFAELQSALEQVPA